MKFNLESKKHEKFQDELSNLGRQNESLGCQSVDHFQMDLNQRIQRLKKAKAFFTI